MILRRWPIRSTGRIVHALMAVVVATFGLWLAVSALHDRREPTVWDAFTATRCGLSGRQGEECTGRWVSDDGRIVLDEAHLHQRVAVDTPVRAGVTTTGWQASVTEQEVFTRRGDGWTWPFVVGFTATAWGLWHLTHLPPPAPGASEPAIPTEPSRTPGSPRRGA